MDPDEDRQKKQMFLKTEILDRGYDGYTFQEYLNAKKPEGGSNIDLWGFDELSEAVKEFRRAHDKNNGKGFVMPSKVGPASNSNQTSEIGDTRKPASSFPGLADQKTSDTFEDYKNCRTSMKSTIKENDLIEIDIVSFEIKPGSLFVPGYALFKVVSRVCGETLTVQRRFSEFYSLRNYFVKAFPGNLIPPIPGKKIGGNLEHGFLQKRMSFLEKFLRDCADTPILKTSKVFQEFLSLDESKIKDKLQDVEKTIKPENVEQFQTISGKALLTINEPTRKYTLKAFDFVKNSDMLYQKLTKLNRQLLMEFDQINITLFNISEVFMALNRNSETFNKELEKPKETRMEDVYLTMNNLLADWGSKMSEQTKIVQNYLSYFFKYEKNYNESLKELIIERNACANEFSKCEEKVRKNALETGSNKLTSMFKKDEAKLEKILKDLKEKFAFYNQSVFEEIDRCLHEKNARYVQDLDKLIMTQIKLIKDEDVLWNGYINELNCLKNGTRPDLKIKKVDIKQVIGAKGKDDKK